jgi:hypothetical protein
MHDVVLTGVEGRRLSHLFEEPGTLDQLVDLAGDLQKSRCDRSPAD